MKILSCSAKNFASYDILDFTFDSQGLTLIQGHTGSGKSTLCDIIPWTLFGRTSKDGAVDEVLSWTGNGPTEVTIRIDSPNIYSVTRIRTSKSSDLYFETASLGRQRGKDIQDTQKLINSLLGMNIDLYLSGSYFHEFSQTAQFFTTTAKNRRAICEQIVDLSLPKKLQEKLAEEKKAVTALLNIDLQNITKFKSNIELLTSMETTEKNKAKNWEVQHSKTVNYVASSYEKFEKSRKKIITNRCNSCGTALSEPKETIDTSENPYLERLAELEKEQNPYTGTVKDFSKEITDLGFKINKSMRSSDTRCMDLLDIEILSSIINDFRGALIQNTISNLEELSNILLSKHFDGEFRIALTIPDSDKLEVVITKDTNTCAYTQLSKGQRGMLKLCFGVAVMRAVSNHHGIRFNQAWFDEALDGMDDNTKIKAYGLLEELSLEYDSIFVVEHSEAFKSLFTNQYKVELINDNSKITRN